MKPDFRIEIPKPCRAGWENMETAEKGRFCGECSKIVIDFTAMSTDEIKTYFLQHKDQRICGHFISSQISKKRRHSEQVLIDLHKKAGKIKYRIPRIAACFLVVSLMTLSGCDMGHSDGEAEYISKEMQLQEDSLLRVAKEMAQHNDSMQKLQYQSDIMPAFDKSADSLKKQDNQ